MTINKMSKNILLISPDGLSTLLFCREIIKNLKSISRAEVIVVCDAREYYNDICNLGVTCISIPMYRWISPWEDIKYCWRLWNAIRSFRIDLIFNFTTKPNIYGTIVGKLAGVKHNYMHVVGLGSGFELRKSISGRIMRSTYFFLYEHACRWSDKVWFTNKKDLQFFITSDLLSDKKAILSRNYLDTKEYALEEVSYDRREEARRLCGLRGHDKVVIMVARMIWQKGIRQFVEAADLLRESNPELKFILVAPLEIGSPDAVPESFVREKEKNGNFKWLQFQADVKRLYAIADLAVLPTYYKEGGYPRALLEPMAMGKPVITTDSEDCRGAIEDGKNGFLVPVQDSVALAAAIERIMTNRQLREALGAYSREKAVRDFDERVIVFDALHRLGLPVQKT